MRKLIVKLCIALLAFISCSGCALDVGLKPPEASTNYLLAASTNSPTNMGSSSVPTVGVGRPQTNTFLNSTGIAVIQPNQEVLYYGKGQWATALPDMMQEAAINSLNSTQQVRSFNVTQAGLNSDYNLIWSIEDFYAKYDTKTSPPVIQVTLNCWLINANRVSKPLDSSTFSGQQTARDKGLEAIVETFNSTVQSLFADMNSWATTTISAEENRKKLQASRRKGTNE